MSRAELVAYLGVAFFLLGVDLEAQSDPVSLWVFLASAWLIMTAAVLALEESEK